MKTHRILLVDDNDIIRLGLNHVLSHVIDCEAITQASNLDIAESELAKQQIDIIMMKFRMPDGSAEEFAAQVRLECPQTKILLLLEEEKEFWEALKVGADGYVLRQIPTYQLSAALKALSDGYGWLGPVLSRYLLKRDGYERLLAAASMTSVNLEAVRKLSSRELEVIRLLADGLTGDEIARRLCISAKTVKLHISNCIRKLDVRDRAQAVAKFLRVRNPTQ